MVKYPEDWKVVPFSETWKSFSTGPFGSALHASDYVEGGTPIVNPIHICNGRIVEERGTTVSDFTVKRLSGYRLCAGDLVMGRRGEMGRVASITTREDGWLCGTGCFFIKLQDFAIPEYVALHLRTPESVNAFEAEAVGTTIPNLNREVAGRVKVVLPPLPEQRRIAAILGNVDKLIDNLAKRIEKKRLVKQGVMQDLLSGKKRLPGFSGEWEEIAFGDCFELLRNNTCARSMMTHAGGKIHNIHYGDILVQYGDVVNCKNTTIPCLTEEGETFACKEYLQDGDIVIADTAEDETAGKVIEVRRVGNLKIVSGLHTVFCRPKSAFAEGWLGHWMNSPLYHRQLVSLMTGIKVLSLSRASFMKTKLAVPTFVEQQAIAKVLGGMDAEIAKLEAKRDKYLKIKQGLMNDLLTGKVRVGAGETAETAATLGPVSEGLGVSAVLGDAVVSETVEVAHG